MIDHDLSFPIILTLAVLILIFWLAGWLPFRDTHHSATHIERLDHRLGRLSTPTIILLVTLGLLWLLLFGLTLAAAFSSILAFHDDPTKGGLGLGAILAGLLGGPFLIWTTVIKQTTLNFQKEGHITDRISKAVEQLGAEKTEKVQKEDGTGSVERTVPNIEVRIGGLLGLERIAQDSTRYDNGRDHVRVMEILCAYVRENAKADDAIVGPLTFLESQSSLTDKLAKSGEILHWVDQLPKPRTDIAISLKIVGGRTAEQRAIEKIALNSGTKAYEPDLSNCNFQRANLSGLDFSGTNFFSSRLEGCFSQNTDFSHCNFIKSKLTGSFSANAVFRKSNMERADLSGSLMDEVDFSLCVFSHSHFVEVQLIGAIFEFLGPDKPNSFPVNSIFLINCNLAKTLFKGALWAGAVISHGDITAWRYQKIMDGVALRQATNAKLGQLFGSDREVFLFAPDQLTGFFGDATVDLGAIEMPPHWPDFALSDKHFEIEWRKWQADQAGYVPPVSTYKDHVIGRYRPNVTDAIPFPSTSLSHKER